MSYDHQDWKEIHFTKKKSPAKTSGHTKAHGAPVTRRSKRKPAGSAKLRRVAEAEGPQKINRVSRSVAQQIVQARQAKGWTRKQLAQKINVKEQVLATYENGSAIPNNQILAKLRQKLGVPLK
jgi:ribosome-binding protein aMBF1 (putative translation factor)